MVRIVTFVHDVPTSLEVHLLEVGAESTKVKQSQIANVKTALKMIMAMLVMILMPMLMMMLMLMITLEMKVLSLLQPSARAPTPWAVSNSHHEMFTDTS